MPNCDNCGNELQDPRDKNAAGWWRDECLPCISNRAKLDRRDDPTDEYEL